MKKRLTVVGWILGVLVFLLMTGLAQVFLRAPVCN